MSTYYVTIDNSYSVIGTGIKTSPLNWNQFVSILSSNTTEDVYCLSGTYSASNINIFSPKQIYLSSDGGNPWIIRAPSSTITLSAFESIYIVNGFVAASTISFNTTSGSVNFDNTLLSLSANLNLNTLSGTTIQACTISNNNTSLNLNFSGVSQTFNFFNNILMLKNINDKSINSFNTYRFYNNVMTSAISAYSFWNGYGNTFIDSNNQPNWVPLSAYTSLATTALNTNNLNYLTSSFSAISASVALGYDPYSTYGITKSTNTFYNGRRDGVGALYFPAISGVAVSASSASSPVSASLNFILNGNDPFTTFSASSATYTWDDGTSNSAVNSNSILSHSFIANGSYQVGSTILSRNKWYSVEANTKTILVGVFNVTITIYDQNGNNVTNGHTKPLNKLTLSATVNGLEVGSYNWDFGDSTSGISNPETKYYYVDGIKNVRLSAYSLEDSAISAIDIVNITVSAVSAEYYVNITSAYDVCANNTGTSIDPFNWAEFKGRVETSGEYWDTYRLSGSRTISKTSSRYILNIDKTKNYIIRDWNVSAYGPWVLEVKDNAVIDSNPIISAAGCTLRNGVIYNKMFGTPGAGGQIIIGNTYDMFIVYQGDYSHITIDPFNNILSGGLTHITSAIGISGAISANYCNSPDWVYMDTYIGEDFKCSAGCSSACVDNWWTDIKNYNFVGPVTFGDYYGCIMYDTPERYFTVTPINGDFDLQWVVAFSAVGANISVHVRVQDTTSATLQDLTFHDTSVYFNTGIKAINNPDNSAIKMKLVRMGTGSNNVSAYFQHFTSATRSTTSEVIGNWIYIDSATINVPIILKADAGNSGYGFGTLKFQADGGLPYTPSITTVSAIPGGWVYLNSYIEDNFETSSFNCWWNSDFQDSYKIISLSGGPAAAMNLIDSDEGYRKLSRNGNQISGDFLLETYLVFSGTDSSKDVGLGLYYTDDSGDYSYTDKPGSIFVTSGYSSSLEIISINYKKSTSTLSTKWLGSLSRSVSGLSSNNIGLRLQRTNNSISAFYKNGTSGTWSAVNYAYPYSGKIFVVSLGNGKSDFEYFRFQAAAGFPNTVSGNVEYIDIVSGSSYNIVTSANSKIIGSTLYLSSGNGWNDNFNSATYSDIGQNYYNLEITDSVITNFEPEVSGNFSACDVYINYSTFNRLKADIEEDFYTSISNSQFEWNPPSAVDYPFRKENALYDKDIDYILNNKKKLRPFSGITVPPNPGKNYPTYSNYETGLFGYSRKDYITSSSG